MTICFVLLPAVVQARVHRSQAWAETQFTRAEAQRETLENREPARTRREYETVIASYRRIVLEAPTSSKADGSAFAVAELTAEMGRHFKDDLALYSAVREYKFLRREYPGSRHRMAALLAIAEIYKNDLSDDSDALPAYKELLRRYPRSELAKQARAEMATLTDPAADNSEATSPDGAVNPSASLGARVLSHAANTPAEKASARPRDSETAQTLEPRSTEGDQASSANGDSSDEDGADRPTRVTGVEYWSSPDYTRVTVDLQQDVRFESQRISHPERIFFDQKNAKLASQIAGRSFNVDDGLVKKVRVAQYKPGLARVVIETAAHASYNASLVLNPPRLVIDIHADDASSGQVATLTELKTADATRETAPNAVTTVTRKLRVEALPAGVPMAPRRVVVEADDDKSPDTHANAKAADSETASGENKKPATVAVQLGAKRTALAAAKSLREAEPTASGDRSLIRTLGLRIGKIVVDPGHGGHDTGTIGPNGLCEKDLVLDVSRRLGKLLEARLGAQVEFTRRDDTFIPLETRTAIANQEQADLFVSVHANSSRDPDARGVETYYLNFTSSPEALEVAARENAASDKSIHELQDLVKKIALKEKIEESHEFASDVQQSLHNGLAIKNSGERDRGVKKAPFVVLIGANMPSILAEISFLSNPGDEKRLKTPEYRQRIAESLYRGIARYVNGLGGVKMATKMEKASAQ